jgi:S1-C subfamily serine protease
VAESFEGWEVALAAQPRDGSYGFDLERALSSVVALRARVPSDAFTAETLGTERLGNAVLIRDDGVLLTIGYLITEADHVTLTTRDGRQTAGHVLGYDQATGFGLVQALDPLDIPALPMATSKSLSLGDDVIVAGAGGRSHAVAAHVVARQAFAGYWEYVLDEAVFTAPAHPHWSGAAMIGPKGELVGIGSLQLEHEAPGGRTAPINMMVPIELLAPIFDDLVSGKPKDQRPWLGLFAQEVEGRIVAMGFAGAGPAKRAGMREGDAILAVAGQKVEDLASFYRRVWSLGAPGVDVPLRLDREGDVFEVNITSGDRRRFLKKPRYN